MSSSPSSGSPNLPRRGIFIGRDRKPSNESLSSSPKSQNDLPPGKVTADHNEVQITTSPTSNNQVVPTPTPPKRAVEPTAANPKRLVPSNPKSLTRITSRGYIKPLPKLMLTIRANQVPDMPANEQTLGTTNNNNAAVPKGTMTTSPKYPAVPPRTSMPNQQVNGTIVPQPPKRAVSAKVPAINPKVNQLTPSPNGLKPTSAQVKIQRKTSRETLVAASPKKGTAPVQELKTSQDAPLPDKPSPSSLSSLPAPKEPTTLLRSQSAKTPPSVPKRQAVTSPASNTNLFRPPTASTTTTDATRKPSNEHRRAVSTYVLTNGVRKSSRDQSLTMRAAPATNRTYFPARKSSRDVTPNQSGTVTAANRPTSPAKRLSKEAEFQPGHRRTPSNQSGGVTTTNRPTSPVKRTSREAEFQPGHRRTPSNQSGSGLARKPSRDTVVVGANAKVPPSGVKTAPSTPTKLEVNGSPPSLNTSGGDRKVSVVPKLALGSVTSAQPLITSDPHRVVDLVTPTVQAPNTARDRTRTQFLDDKPVVVSNKPKPLYSTFTGHNNVMAATVNTTTTPNTTPNTTPKKPAPPSRSATISGQTGLKSRVGVKASPKKTTIGLARQEPLILPTKLRKRTYSVSKKKSKKVVLTSVTSNNTQPRVTALSPGGVLVSNQSFTNSVTISTINSNESKVMDNLSMLLGWALQQSHLYCIYANGSVVLHDLVAKVAVIRLFIPAMRPANGSQEKEAKRIQNCVLMATEHHLLAVVNFVSELHHTFVCWNVARLGGMPDVFELSLKYDNKPFYPLHNCCSMDGNIVALSSGETVLVFLYNVETPPKQLCELNIRGGSVFKAWQLDVSAESTVKPIEVAGHIVDSVLIFGDNDGKVSVLDTFGRQLCTASLPRQSIHETSSPKILSPRGSPAAKKPTVSQKINCFHVVRNTHMFFAGHEDGTVSLWLLDQEEGNCILSPLKSYQVHGPIQDMFIDYKAQNSPGSHLLISVRKLSNEPPTVLFLELPKFLREIVQRNL